VRIEEASSTNISSVGVSSTQYTNNGCTGVYMDHNEVGTPIGGYNSTVISSVTYYYGVHASLIGTTAVGSASQSDVTLSYNLLGGCRAYLVNPNATTYTNAALSYNKVTPLNNFQNPQSTTGLTLTSLEWGGNDQYLDVESWTTATLLHGWTNQGGGLYTCQYKMIDRNTVWLIGVISSASMSNVQFMTLPASLSPQNTGGDYPLGFHTGTGSGQGAFLRVSTTGACSIINSNTSTGAVAFNTKIPLDNI
jgi:hypothetical protein